MLYHADYISQKGQKDSSCRNKVRHYGTVQVGCVFPNTVKFEVVVRFAFFNT